MCLIIASPKGQAVDPTISLYEIWMNNPHGFGIMWADKGQLKIKKTLTISQVGDLFKEAEGMPWVAHWRYSTHGQKNLDNCHPFKIRKDIYMAHNGILDIPCFNGLMSDTWHLAKMLQAVCHEPDCLFEKTVMTDFGKEIGRGNKLAFLAGDGRLAIVNENLGNWDAGLWYSNTYSLYPAVYTTKNWDYAQDGTYDNKGYSYTKPAHAKNSKWAKTITPTGRSTRTVYQPYTQADGTIRYEQKQLPAPSATVIPDENGRVEVKGAPGMYFCEMCGDKFSDYELNRVEEEGIVYWMCNHCTVDFWEENPKCSIESHEWNKELWEDDEEDGEEDESPITTANAEEEDDDIEAKVILDPLAEIGRS